MELRLKKSRISTPTRSRRDIQENSKSPIFGDIFGLKCLTAPKIVVPITAKIGVDNPEGTRRRSMSVALPTSSPKRHYQEATPMIQQLPGSDENKWDYCNAPLNFASFDLKFKPRTKPHVRPFIMQDFFRFKNGPFLPLPFDFIFELACTSVESYAPLYVKTSISLFRITQ